MYVWYGMVMVRTHRLTALRLSTQHKQGAQAAFVNMEALAGDNRHSEGLPCGRTRLRE